MRLSALPVMITDSITDLTPAFLRGGGIELLMLDFDNTIVPYTTNVAEEKISAWLQEMLASPVQICVVSNSRNDRVKRFCQAYGIPCITHARKPFPKGIRECLVRFGKSPEQCALAGDQIFTDTLGANGVGVRSILVRAIDNHNIWLKLRHVAELPFIFAARKRRLTYEEY
ncbi:MAG: YqeG family HAD IIIA-type phosphatase [Oscillospiraceae bacterium]|nr:YqeG family HAD IIIA-type phosphatase [Oscillospiraceae bacterium]